MAPISLPPIFHLFSPQKRKNQHRNFQALSARSGPRLLRGVRKQGTPSWVSLVTQQSRMPPAVKDTISGCHTLPTFSGIYPEDCSASMAIELRMLYSTFLSSPPFFFFFNGPLAHLFFHSAFKAIDTEAIIPLTLLQQLLVD